MDIYTTETNEFSETLAGAIKTINKCKGPLYTLAGTGDLQIAIQVNKTDLIRTLNHYMANENMKNAEVTFSKVNGELWFDGLN